MPSISLEIKLFLIIIKMVTMIKYYLVAAIASVFVWGFFHFFFFYHVLSVNLPLSFAV